MSTDDDMERLTAAAQAGDVGAMTTLGKRLIASPVSSSSSDDGQKYLQSALQAESGEAAAFIAILFATGMSGQQNWEVALDYMALSASYGWRPAFEQLSCLADMPIDIAVWEQGNADIKSLRARIKIDELLTIPDREVLSEAPRIRKFQNFIPERFCEWMIDISRPKLGRARIYDDEAKEGRESDVRTNSEVSFDLLDLDLVLILIQTKIAQSTSVPLFAMEKSKVLHYKVGEEFRPHHDYLDPKKPAHAADMRQYGQRLATCLIYLNNDFKGAETSFPRLNQKFRCETGGAILFANIDMNGQPDPETLHAGLAPIDGEKWIFSQWVRSGPLPS